MRIRKEKTKNLNEISKLFKEEFTKSPYNQKWTKEQVKKIIKNYFNKDNILILIEDKIILGFIIFKIKPWNYNDICEIQELVIKKEAQGKGYGSKLIKYLEQFLKKRQKNIWMNIQVNKKSKAIEFYKKNSYKILNDLAIMWKEIK